MFKNRAVQMKLVKTDDADETVPVLPAIEITKQDVIDVTNHVIETSAKAVIAVVAVVTIAKTSSAIAIHHGTKN